MVFNAIEILQNQYLVKMLQPKEHINQICKNATLSNFEHLINMQFWHLRFYLTYVLQNVDYGFSTYRLLQKMRIYKNLQKMQFKKCHFCVC